jgi:hypothetical protein
LLTYTNNQFWVPISPAALQLALTVRIIRELEKSMHANVEITSGPVIFRGSDLPCKLYVYLNLLAIFQDYFSGALKTMWTVILSQTSQVSSGSPEQSENRARRTKQLMAGPLLQLPVGAQPV